MHLQRSFFIALSCLFIAGAAAQSSISYSGQKFSVSHISVAADYERDGVKGLLYTADVRFSYAASEIRGASSNGSLKQFYFSLEIKDRQGLRAYAPQHKPDNYKFYAGTEDDFRVLSATNTLPQALSIFIPYNQLSLSSGPQQVTILLNASNAKGDITFQAIGRTEFAFFQPPTYLARFDLKKLRVMDGKYDIPGKKIPLLGLFFSDKSAAGQGSPDLAWKIMMGRDTKYLSATHQDAFTAYEGVATFRVAENDPIRFLVVDEDYFKSDEVLGTLSLPTTIETVRFEQRDIAFDKVESTSFIFEKTRIPSFDELSVTAVNKQFEGVSGVEVSVSYALRDLQSAQGIFIRPVFTDAADNRWLPDFIKLVNVNLELGKYGRLVETRNGKDEQVFFVPHYAVYDSMRPGVDFIMDGYDQVISSVTAEAPAKMYDVAVNDAVFAGENSEEVLYKGYWGLKIPLSVYLPDMYYDDLDYTDFEFSIVLNDAAGRDITDSLMVVSLQEKQDLRHLVLRKITKEKNLFLPYCKLPDPGRAGTYQLMCNAQWLTKNMSVGHENFGVRFPGAEVVPVRPFEVTCRKKKDDYTGMRLRLLHGGHEIARSEIVSGNAATIVFAGMTEKVHVKDELKIEVLGITPFGYEEKMGAFTFTNDDILINILPEFNLPKKLKKLKIKPLKVK